MAGTRTASKKSAQKPHFNLPSLLNLIGRPIYWNLLLSLYLLLAGVSVLPVGSRLLGRLLTVFYRLPYLLVRLSLKIIRNLGYRLLSLLLKIPDYSREIINHTQKTLNRLLTTLTTLCQNLNRRLTARLRLLLATAGKLIDRVRLAFKHFLQNLRRLFVARSTRKPRPRPKAAKHPVPAFRFPRLSPAFLNKPVSVRYNFKRLLIVLIICLFGLIGFFGYSFIRELPNPDRLSTRDQALTTKIYDRHGQLLYKIYRNQNRTLVRLEDIPLELIQATIAIEDAEFYRHPGLSWRGITRAFLHNLESDRLYGGSTITQQLVKNTLLTPERTWSRKVKEAVLAVWVERRYSKDEILQMYLNEVPYGGTVYGAEEAAQKYFGKSVRDINLAEAAFLAGLPASPNHFSPFGVSPQVAKERQAVVLERMRQESYISDGEARLALGTDLYLAPQKVEIRAPHFVMYVKNLLETEYGKQLVEQGGLSVVTSLDLALQEKVQRIVTDEVFKLSNLRVGNGAALVTRPSTGEILAMVGSKDYFDLENDGNVNVTTRPRQPGSSIKPLMYSLALTKGFTAATAIPDTPITYQVAGQPPYTPHNYDNRFHGNTPLRVALASSYNVPAVKVLSALGVRAFIDHASKLGITTWDEPDRFGLSLTLGGGEVTMTDMAVAYGTLANLGQKVDLSPILEVRDAKGKLLKTNSAQDQPQTGEDEFPNLATTEVSRETQVSRAENNLQQSCYYCVTTALQPYNFFFSNFSISHFLSPITNDVLASEPASAFTLSESVLSEPVLRGVEGVEGVEGSALSPQRSALGTVVDPRITYIITDILADNAARTPAFGPRSVLVIPDHPHVAVKTGTTQNLRDNWTIGYTPDYLTAVWVGNNDNTPMSAIASGVTGASPIWQKIMIEVLKDVPDKEFPLPDGLVKTEICPTTGTLPCSGCGGKWEYFLPGTEPTAHCVPKVTADSTSPGQNSQPENKPHPRDRKREPEDFFEVVSVNLE